MAEALPKSQAATSPSATPANKNPLDEWEDEEFVRLTRRALSHFGNLSKLTASPLTRLPAVEARLATGVAGLTRIGWWTLAVTVDLDIVFGVLQYWGLRRLR